MRIAIVSVDTRGGIQPYIALGLGLQRAGHQVRLVAPADFIGWIKGYGLDVAPMSGNTETVVRASQGVAEKGALATMRYARQQSITITRQWAVETLAGCEGVEVITGGIGGMATGLCVAEKLKIPFVETHLQPVGVPTGAFPGVMLPGMPRWLGAWGRRLSHRLTETAVWLPFEDGRALARREVLGLPGKPKRTTVNPVLYGFSRHVIPLPPEWAGRCHITGYWHLPAPEGFVPPPGLEAFLSAGPRPVCVGFGSMASGDAEATTRVVLEAAKQAGQRLVLLSGWGGLAAEVAGRSDVFVTDAVPHDWLYPRMAAVVHHGGAGTTAAAWRAGVPALVVPFTMDQPFWGKRGFDLGVGPQPIPRKHLTVERLAQGLRAATTDPAMAERAAKLGELLRAEDGVAEAVRLFGEFAGRLRVS